MSRDGAIVSDVISSGSPKNRLKFLCSHGGQILPRPADGQLKYVGGETRVISVARDISFPDLMKKLTYQSDGEVTLKYKVASEDLDALVSVKSDEDVGFMLDEIERCENVRSCRLRAFLFPTTPVLIESQTSSMDSQALDQRYIDAVNGITRTAPKPHPMIAKMVRQGSLVSSSGCSSPPSPDSYTSESVNNISEPIAFPRNNYHSGRMMRMHKVRSSPNICSMGVNEPQQGHHLIHRIPSPQPQAQQYVNRYSPGPGYQSSLKPPVDPPRAERRLISVRSVGSAEGARYQQDPTISAPLPHHHYSTSKQNMMQLNTQARYGCT